MVASQIKLWRGLIPSFCPGYWPDRAVPITWPDRKGGWRHGVAVGTWSEDTFTEYPPGSIPNLEDPQGFGWAIRWIFTNLGVTPQESASVVARHLTGKTTEADLDLVANGIGEILRHNLQYGKYNGS